MQAILSVDVIYVSFTFMKILTTGVGGVHGGFSLYFILGLILCVAVMTILHFDIHAKNCQKIETLLKFKINHFVLMKGKSSLIHTQSLRTGLFLNKN